MSLVFSFRLGYFMIVWVIECGKVVIIEVMSELNPEWLTKEFLSDCLQNESNNPNLVVTDFKVESAVPPGNNFGSIVARVKLSYTEETRGKTEKLSKSLIIKLPLTHGAVKDIFGQALDNETIFYKQYLPEAYKLLKQEFTPKSYPSSSIPVVVLEDLKESGYKMEDRQKNLDLHQCKLYARAAAAFHAGSLVMCRRNPDLAKNLCSEKMYSNEARSAVPTRNMIQYGLDCLADHILKTMGDQSISSIVRRSSAILWDLLVDSVQPTGCFDTFNQADPWITNMMFQYDDKDECVGVKLLDFQGIRYASPATDLTFFLWTTAKHYVREEYFEDFLGTYVESMNRYLEEMKCVERMSLDKLKKEMLRTSPQSLYIVACYSMYMYLPDPPDFGGMFAHCEQKYNPKANPLEKFYTEEFCRTHMVRLVKQMEKLKIFEYLEFCLENK